MQEAHLIRYTRKQKTGQLNGCLVAAKIGGIVKVGYSKCCNTDVFSKKFAKELAIARMNKCSNRHILGNIPKSMIAEFNHFQTRMKKYFKN